MGFSFFFFFQSIIRQRRDSAAITARGHPILANPKEPLKTFFFLLFLFKNSRTQRTHLRACVVWSSLFGTHRHVASSTQLSVIVVIGRRGTLLCAYKNSMFASLSIGLVHLIYTRKLLDQFDSSSKRGKCREREGGGNKGLRLGIFSFITSFELQISFYLFFVFSVHPLTVFFNFIYRHRSRSKE